MGRLAGAFGAAALGLLLAFAVPAVAQEGDARQRQAAAEAYDQGTAAYVARDYVKAAQWFETANRLSPAAPALIQGARSHYRAGNMPRAATLALQLTLSYASEPAALEVGDALLREIAPTLVRVDVTCDGCSLDVGGTLQEHKSFFVAPDTAHTVTASFETGERTAEVSGAAGEAKALAFEAPPPPPVVVEPKLPKAGGAEPLFGEDGQPRDHAKKPLPPIVTFIGAGLTGALLIGSILSTVDMYAHADKFDTAADESNAACSDPSRTDCTELYNRASKLLDDGEPTEIRTTILWVATGVVGAATAVIALTLTDWSGGEDDEHASTLRLQPLLDPVQGSAGLRLGARF